jgi:predicted ATPase/DNA-binding XRE family transcriptional regulator
VDEGLTFGSWLRQQRRVLDLTQKELAAEAGCAVITVRKMEAGELKPSKSLAGSLAGALGIKSGEVEAFVDFARSETGLLAADRTSEAGPRPWLPKGLSEMPLPAPLKKLIGREHDLAAVRSLLSRPEVRLVTIAGPPGVGKTSLAVDLAHELFSSYRDGCFYVELADIQEAASVLQAIAAELGVQPAARRPVLEQLRAFLHEKQMLLVLDNCEHVLAAAPMIYQLLQGCPELNVLTTSRASLQLLVENQYPLSPLLLPDPDRRQTILELAEYPSIDLFVSRARAAQPDFRLSEANAATISAICRRLDGLPLAIELAASKTKLLSTAELMSRLEASSTALKAEFRDLPQRQRSLQVTLDWSYELLTDQEKAVFACMAAFSGGCSLAAAEAVGGASLNFQVAEFLEALIDKCLLVRMRKAARSSHRISMLKTIREYAVSRLTQSGFMERVQAHHAAYYLKLAGEAESELRGPDQILWLDRLKREHLNLRSAISWALTSGDVETALGLAGSLARYWELHSHLEEGRSLLEKAMAQSEHLEAGRALSNTHMRLRAKALRGASALAQNQGDWDQANRWGLESLRLWRTLGDRKGEAGVLHTLGLVAQGRQQLGQAQEYHQACLHLAQQLEDEVRIYISLYNLAEVASRQHDYELAEQLHRESLALKEQHGDSWSISWSKFCLAKLAGYRGDWQEAAQLQRECIQLRQQLGDKEAVAESLVGFAHIASQTDSPQRAARLLGGADKLLEASGGVLSPHAIELYQQSLSAVNTTLDKEAMATCLEEGRSWSIASIISYAVADGDG